MRLTHQFEPEKEEKFNFKARKFVVAAGVLILALVIVEIWVIHTLSGYGQKARKIEELQKNLELENEILENEISEQSSLNKIASSSASYGLDKPKKVRYIR